MFCRIIYHWWIEKQIDDHGHICSPVLQHHLEKCRSCQMHYQQLIRLGQRIRSAEPVVPLDSKVFDRIYASIQLELADEALSQRLMVGSHSSIQSPTYSAIRYIAAMLVFSAIAGLWFLTSHPQQNPEVPQLSLDTAALRTQAAIIFQSPERSIQTEILKLKADINNAVGFLQSCTPESPFVLEPEPASTELPQP